MRPWLGSVSFAVGFFVPKIRNRMNDETLVALITKRQHYQKQKKACANDNDK